MCCPTGYNIIFWLKGTLPWSDKSAENVAKEKSELSVNTNKKLSTIFGANDSHSNIIVDYLSKYFDISYNTSYKDKPDYAKLKSLTNDLISKLIAVSKNQKTLKLNRDEDRFTTDVKRSKANPKLDNFDGMEENCKTENVKPTKNNKKVEISPYKNSNVGKKKKVDTTEVLSENNETECDENDISLPDGWEEHKSRSTGEIYYINIYTNKSQWTVPTEPAAPHNQDRNKPFKSDEIRVSHILCKHKDSKRPSSWREDKINRTKDEALDRIKVFRNDIINGKKSFARIAQKYSDCPSAKQGGDLGFFGRGRMQKPFEDASFSLKVDQLSKPVITDSGIHLILRTA
uniref:peptidylprolyl isomerase n=1 Tax=Romanomermis culicivorax TaxID=13658 RepID=A0A915IN24_ROMCU